MTTLPRVSRAPALLFGVALAVRLGVLAAGPWADPGRATFDDSARYINLAANLKATGGFGLAAEEDALAWRGLYELRVANGTQPPRDAHGMIPEVLRTPGYPVVVAAAWGLAGDLRAVLVLQCLLGAAAAVCLRRVALASGLSDRAALVAGGLWAVHPGVVTRDCQFMTESLFNSLAVVSLWWAAAGRGWRGWVLAGACLGGVGLIRPLGALYLPVVAAAAARRTSHRVAAVAVVAALTLLPSAAWAVRNAAVGNGLRVSTVGDVTLFYYFAGYTISEERGEDWVGRWPTRSAELLAKLRARVGPGDDVFAAMRAISREELQARPAVAARVLAKSWVKLAVAHSAGDAAHLVGEPYRPSNLVARLVLREEAGGGPGPGPAALVLPALWTLANVAVLGLAAAGAAVGLRRREWAFILPLGLTVALFTVATMSQGMERFRTPFMFALFLLAARVAGRNKTG